MSVREAFRDPRGYAVRTVGMYRALLFDPETFYEEYVGSRGIWVELLVVAVIGALGLAGNVYMLDQLTMAVEEAGISIGDDTNFNLIGNTLAPMVGAFLLWVAYSASLYLIGWLYSTQGQFFGVLKRAAWALVPLAFYNVIQTVAKVFIAFSYTEDDAEGLSPPRPSDQRAEAIWSEIAGETIVVVAVALGVIFVVWAGYIGAYAIAKERDLNRSDALKVTAVPTAAFAIYVLYEAATAFL